MGVLGKGIMRSGSLLRKLLCLWLLLGGVPGSGAAGQGTREAMADAMARMMEAMGLFDAAPTQQAPGSASGWGSAPGTPWDGPLQERSRAMTMGDLMRQFSGQMVPPGESSGDWTPTWEPSQLEGVWEGRDGGLLIVQRDRFRVYSPGIQRVDGLLRIQGDRLALYNPLDRQARPFEFAEHQGRLIMRDLSGQLYLYRRLRLGDGQGL